MKLNLATLIFAWAATVPLASVGAFFLYVSPLTILFVAALLTAVVLVFAAGVLPVLARQSEEENSDAQPCLPAVVAPRPSSPHLVSATRLAMKPGSQARRVAPSEFL